MDKIISFTVPCYNSQEYMRKCIDSILVGGEDVEIIIVNDGSKDETINIAREYESKYPTIVRVVDKENGGHGSGVNAGMRTATGIYFKVVDSDDWLDSSELLKLIARIKTDLSSNQEADLYITNFIYDKPSVNGIHVSEYTKKIKEGVLTTWDNVKKFYGPHVLMMHALLYKREKLLSCGIELPEKTFYVDNIFAYMPLPYMKKICYLNLNLYHYFIGRADQSVNINNFVKRYDQQLRVMDRMVKCYTLAEIKSMPKGLKKYMWHDLMAIMMNTLMFTCAEYSKERKKGLNNLWQEIKKFDIALYRKLRYRSYASVVNFLPWRMAGAIMKLGYKILCEKIKLG